MTVESPTPRHETVVRPVAVLLASLLVLGSTAVAPPFGFAQSVWLDRDRPSTIQLEILKPDPDGDDELTFGSSIWYLTGRYEFSPTIHGVLEMPFGNAGREGTNAGGWIGGNPYAGVEFGTKESTFLGEFGVRVPIGGEDLTTSTLGLFSDTERWPAWLFSDVAAIRAGFHARSRPSSAGLWFDGRFAPEFVFDGNNSELWGTYGAALRLTRPAVRAGASFSGRVFYAALDEGADVATLHELDLAADFGDWKLRPGVSLTVPIDEDLSEVISLIYGVSLSYAP